MKIICLLRVSQDSRSTLRFIVIISTQKSVSNKTRQLCEDVFKMKTKIKNLEKLIVCLLSSFQTKLKLKLKLKFFIGVTN